MINLHEPCFDETDENFILEAIRSTWVSTGGPFVDRFEREFAEFVNAKHAISVCNGTIGLQLAIECLKRKSNIFESFEVMTPSLTFIATANSIVHAGGHPVFIDVDKNSFQISPSSLKNIIIENYEYDNSEKFWRNRVTKCKLLAFIPVHIMGWSAPIDELAKISSEFSIPMLEDASEALGSYYFDREHVGKSGLASVFSFNGNKILTTGGGGMIVTNDDTFATYLKHLSTTAKIDKLRFVHDEVGYNYRLINILAALGCSQLKKLPKKLELKKEIFNCYFNILNKNHIKIYEQKDCISNNWLVNIVFENHEMREIALNCLIENNIQARPLWTPCHLQPAYGLYKNESLNFFNTENIWKKTLSLPTSAQLTIEQIKMISNLIITSLSGA